MRRIITAALAGTALWFSLPTQAETLMTFDDITTKPYLPTPNLTYEGFALLGGLVMDPVAYVAAGGLPIYAGLTGGVVSPTYLLTFAALSLWDTPDMQPFTLNSGYFTGNKPGTVISVKGRQYVYDIPGVSYRELDMTFTVTPGEAIYVPIDWTELARVQITSTDPQAVVGVDNLLVNAPVPEPATWALLAGGIPMMLAAARRRTKV